MLYHVAPKVLCFTCCQNHDDHTTQAEKKVRAISLVFFKEINYNSRVSCGCVNICHVGAIASARGISDVSFSEFFYIDAVAFQ